MSQVCARSTHNRSAMAIALAFQHPGSRATLHIPNFCCVHLHYYIMNIREVVRPVVLLPDVRVGHGYDTHRLVSATETEEIVLCGVKIPHNASLLGHSDADVGLHALVDALLATISADDIGSHFPPSDPQWTGVSSGTFLAHAAKLVDEAGGTITHCDVTLVCEAPKISPYRDLMKTTIANLLNLARKRVSIKATTNERLGFVGRQEGIFAIATATVVFPRED